jgi:hypothetical protein
MEKDGRESVVNSIPRWAKDNNDKTDLIFHTTKCLEQLWILKVISLPIGIH